MEKLFKLIIIGDPTVGKTSFINKYVHNSYRRDYKGTIGGRILVQLYAVCARNRIHHTLNTSASLPVESVITHRQTDCFQLTSP